MRYWLQSLQNEIKFKKKIREKPSEEEAEELLRPWQDKRWAM